MLWIFTDLCKYLVSPFRLPSGEIAHAGKKKVLRTFLFHHLELTRKEFRGSEVINHMPAFHVVAGIAICTPHCAANDDIHVLNLIFDTNTHDFCHSSRFFLMRSRHSSNRVISSSENLCSKYCPSHQIQNRTRPLRHVLSQSKQECLPFVRFRLNTAYQPLIFHSFQHRSKRCYR